MDHFELNLELRDFCKKLISDGYSKSQICSVILGQQRMPMFTQFLDNETRNFGVGVLSQIFDVFGYRLEIVPILKTNEEEIENINITENFNKFIENYHMLMSEGLANQETAERGDRESKVATAITDLALDMFQKIVNK
jgi:hypothetical protein